jgi:DNA-binding MarR family transcriptional regulator
MDDEALGAWRAFINAHARITRQVNRDLAAADLPDIGWYDVLWPLHRAPGRRLRMGELADQAVLSRTGLVRLVDRLERAGMVRREAVEGDRRGSAVAITEPGSDLLKRMWPVYRAAIEEHFGAHLGAAAPRLRRALERMSDSASD